MSTSVKNKIYIETINKQKAKIKKLEAKKEKVYTQFPKSMYSDSMRSVYLDDYDKKIDKCNAIISELRSKMI